MKELSDSLEKEEKELKEKLSTAEFTFKEERKEIQNEQSEIKKMQSNLDAVTKDLDDALKNWNIAGADSSAQVDQFAEEKKYFEDELLRVSSNFS